jgi:UDP-glucuronate 4-epimerase
MALDSILVTGAAGFIGSHFAEALLDAGHHVVGIDSLDPFYNPKIKEMTLDLLQKHDNFVFEPLDICSRSALEELFARHTISIVAHLAARAGVRNSILHPNAYAETNIGGTINLLELSCQNEVGRFLFASSSSVYGSRTSAPFREEDSTDFPLSPYAATKKAGEALCYTYHHLHSLPLWVFRFFTVHGPRGRPDMAPLKFLHRTAQGIPLELYGDLSSSRDYTYVKDVVSGLMAAFSRDVGFEIVNLGNSHPVSLSDLVDTVERVVGTPAIRKHAPPAPGDVPLTCAAIDKARRLLDYQPTTSLEEGLRKTYNWYTKNEIARFL